MFTGIVEQVGTVAFLGQERLGVQFSKVLAGLKTGDSIAVNGACLTVVELGLDTLWVDLSPETLRRTNLGVLKKGDGVNLERPLGATDRLQGHIVQGHVDGTGVVRSFKPEGGSVLFGFGAPRRLMPYIVEKGFVAVDGSSLTVIKRGTSSFTVAVIPYTLEHTVLKDRERGDRVNLEVDIVAKYVESLLKRESHAQPGNHPLGSEAHGSGNR